MKRILITTVVGMVLVVLGACGHPTPEGLVFKTADPNLSIGFRWAQPDVVPSEEVGEVEPVPPIAPPCAEIKGNISRSGEKIYHMQGQANYAQVKIDEGKGEMWFCDEQSALDAGWRKSSR